MVNLVREGRRVWPTCSECGCRLDISVVDEWACLTHFGLEDEKDARGCFCPIVNQRTWVITRSIEHIIGV